VPKQAQLCNGRPSLRPSAGRKGSQPLCPLLFLAPLLAILALSGCAGSSGVQVVPPPVSYSVALQWNPSTSAVIGYNVYRGTVSGGPYTQINPSLVTTTKYQDSDVESGQTYYYVVTSVDSSNVESTYSNQTSATIPNS
jgi:hypothetical protein